MNSSSEKQRSNRVRALSEEIRRLMIRIRDSEDKSIVDAIVKRMDQLNWELKNTTSPNCPIQENYRPNVDELKIARKLLKQRGKRIINTI